MESARVLPTAKKKNDNKEMEPDALARAVHVSSDSDSTGAP
jgi:hypothetical protein